MKKWFREQENRIDFFVFIAVMIVVGSPLITKLCLQGHDLEYHLLRIESLKNGILMGKPFLKINTLFLGDTGYASSLFYPDFLLYFPAILRALGVGINLSFHLFVALCICLTYLSTRFCVKKITGSVYSGNVAGVLMVMSPYFLGDVFIRAAVGEYMAFIFLPFVIYGIYNTLYEHMDKPWLLALGFGGVLLSHTNTFIFCIILGFVAFLIKWKVFRDDIKVLLRLLATAGITMALTAFYWIPVLEMMMTTPLKVNEPWIALEETALNFSDVLTGEFPSLGFLLVVLAFLRVLVKKNPQNRNMIGYADWLLFGGGVLAFLTTDIIPWERFNSILSFVQFPWRLLCLSTAMLSIADAIIIYCFIKSSLEPLMQGSMRIITVLILIICASVTFSFVSKADLIYYDYSDDYYSYKPFTAGIIAGEWLPSAVESTGQLLDDSDFMYDDAGNTIDFERVKNTIEADITGEYNYIDVPFVYYKGYSAYIVGEDNVTKTINVVQSERNGLTRVETNKEKGHLTVKYKGTPIQKCSTIISIFTLLALVGIMFYRKKGKGDTK